MKVRYTYFATHPCGYAIYDELTRRVVAYASDKLQALRLVLDLNHGGGTAA